MLKTGLPLDLPRSIASDLFSVCCLLGDPAAGGQEGQDLESRAMGCRDRGGLWGPLGSSHTANRDDQSNRKQEAAWGAHGEELVMEISTSPRPLSLSQVQSKLNLVWEQARFL